jgi:hypothetical protein
LVCLDFLDFLVALEKRGIKVKKADLEILGIRERGQVSRAYPLLLYIHSRKMSNF